jgi:hypothetical protein
LCQRFSIDPYSFRISWRSPHQAVRNVVSRIAHHAESQSLVPVSQFGIFQVLTPRFLYHYPFGRLYMKIFSETNCKIFVRCYHKDFVVFFFGLFAIVPIRSSTSYLYF